MPAIRTHTTIRAKSLESLWLVLVASLISAGCGEDEPLPTHSQPVSTTGEAAGEAASAESRYVTSVTCKKCHEEQYDSWHSTYHRTMTQEPTPDAVKGRFDDQPITVSGYPCRAFRRGDRFFMTIVEGGWDRQQLASGLDPTKSSNPRLVTYAVDRVIGSHHQQVYLTLGPDGDYHTLPLTWHIAHQRWITRKASFLSSSPAGFYTSTKLWNNSCIFCHNTGPRPGLQRAFTVTGAGGETSEKGIWKSEVAELGIACEACHGPGGHHAQQAERFADSEERPDDFLIVNPSNLTQEQSILVCSRCHGKMNPKTSFGRLCLVEGDFFQSGDWDYPDRYVYPMLDPDETFDERREGQYFWSDGTPRTTALEYQGLLLSPCYQGGEFTCLSCHSMHDSHPVDQLRFGDSAQLPVAHQNRACLQCHQDYTSDDKLREHTHHEPQTAGSLCYNCHMPYQAYSLLKRVRSHRINVPSAASTVEFGLPNACNQCHVNESLDWVHQTLASWKEQTPAPLHAPHRDVSSTVVHALSGHALQRALALEQLGDAENFRLAGSDWRSRVVIELLEDDYEANRLLAFNALKKLNGFDDFEFDFIGTEEARQASVSKARQKWEKVATDDARSQLRKVLKAKADAEVDALIQQLITERNDVRISILE